MIIDRTSIENLVGTKISKIDLYQKAFTHKSALKENDSLEGSFETLEFIGDSVLGFVITKFLFDQYEKDIWRGYIQSADLPDIQAETAIFPTGKAGTVTIHNCRTIHGSYPNHSSHRRPLLLQTYSAADAFAYTDLVRKTKHGEHIIRGKVSRWARHDPRPCLVPPTKVGTIFQAQQKEI